MTNPVYFQDENGDVWKLLYYSEEPTMTIAKVANEDERVGGVIGAPIFDRFKRLEVI